MRILVIEDSDKSARLEKKILEKEGNKVLVEKCGEAGLNTAKKEQPELILLDKNLPDL